MSIRFRVKGSRLSLLQLKFEDEVSITSQMGVSRESGA